MSTMSPFHVLQELESLGRANSAGLPSGKESSEEWLGVGFRLLGLPCIAEMGEVVEILPPPPTVRVPRVQDWVLGMANVRGNLLPIFDLEGFLGSGAKERGPGTRVLVVHDEELRAGLMVPEVLGMRRFHRGTRMDASASGSPVAGFIDGSYAGGGQTWHVFSIKRLARNADFMKVAA